MSPTFSYGKSKRLYLYHVSAPMQQGQRFEFRAVSADATPVEVFGAT
jgi:hypothetical protein